MLREQHCTQPSASNPAVGVCVTAAYFGVRTSRELDQGMSMTTMHTLLPHLRRPHLQAAAVKAWVRKNSDMVYGV